MCRLQEAENGQTGILNNSKSFNIRQRKKSQQVRFKFLNDLIYSVKEKLNQPDLSDNISLIISLFLIHAYKQTCKHPDPIARDQSSINPLSKIWSIKADKKKIKAKCRILVKNKN